MQSWKALTILMLAGTVARQLEVAIIALKEALLYDAVEDGKQAAVA